jgi:hypothetical protein
MKIALIEKTSSKITPLQIIKEDPSNQKATEIVQIFAAR